jgi:HIP---CoA ligase
MSDPAAERTLPRMVAAAVARYGDRPAIEDGDVRLTFAELGAAGWRAARAFLAAGVTPGDRVAIWAPNVAEWVIAGIGIQTIGAILVPISTRNKGAETAYVLQKSGARVLCTIAGFLDTDYVGMLAGHELPALERIVMLRGEAPASFAQRAQVSRSEPKASEDQKFGERRPPGAQRWSDFLASGESVPESAARTRAEAVKPSDVADMLFTSGTTGKPKGVLCEHGQNLEAFEVWSGWVGVREGDRYLVVAPFFHSFGYKAGWLSALMRGATIFPHAVFDAEAVLARIERERITVLPGPPTIYHSLLAVPNRRDYDLSSLRLAVTGAAAIPVELVHQMRDDLGFATVLTAYGLTESSGVVTICAPGDDPETIATTSGRAIPGTEVRCVDPDGKEVPRGQPGEIWVRGYNVMRGYFDAEEQTREAIDTDGWLHTGDVGVMDERGYLRITDRIKDMFIVGGFNCYPAEIENLMFAHDAIAQVAVIGVPDARMGEVGMAFVVPATGHAPTAESLRAWCRQEMANYKVPARIEVLSALPLNASGKVDKLELRRRATESRG